MERRLTVLCLVASASLLFLLHWQVFFSRIYVSGDTTGQNMPVRFFYQQALRSGESFLWMPQLFCGFYVHGEGQGGLCHPLHLLLYWLVPLAVSITLESLGAYLWAFIGTYFLLRRFQFPAPACIFGAMSFAFSGFNLMHYAHMNGIEVISHIPWLILIIDILLRATDRKVMAAAAVAYVLLKGSQFLLGYPFYVWCSFMVEVPFALWVMATSAGFRRTPILLCALVFSVLVGAIQLQPTRDMLLHSARSNVDFNFRMQFSSHPLNLLSLWSPQALKDQFYNTPFYANKCEVNPYNGMFCTFSLLWCLIRRRYLLPWNRLLKASAVFAVVMLILSLGYYGLVYQAVSFFPVFKSFRCSGRYLLLVHLACSVFVTAAVTDILRLVQKDKDAGEFDQRQVRLLFLPVILSLLTAAVIVVARFGPGKHVGLAPLLGSPGDALYGVLLSLGVWFLIVAAARGRAWGLYGIVLLTVLDLSQHWGTIYLKVIPTATLPRYLKSLPETPDPGSGRLLTDQIDDSIVMKNGSPIANGYAGLFPERIVPLWDIWQGPYKRENDLPARQLAAVRWVHPKRGDGTVDPERWEAVPGSLPRVRMLTRVVATKNVAADLLKYDVSRVALMPYPINLEPAPSGHAQILKDRPGHTEVRTTATTRQILVLSESWHPGWSVTIDNEAPSDILRAYGDYQACVVESGQHIVRFDFAPKSFETGKKGTFLGLFLTGIFYLFLRFGVTAKRREN